MAMYRQSYPELFVKSSEQLSRELDQALTLTNQRVAKQSRGQLRVDK